MRTRKYLEASVLATLIILFLTGCSQSSSEPDTSLTPQESAIGNIHSANGIYFQAKHAGQISIRKQEPDGSISDLLAGEETQFWWPRVSPDKSTLLWYQSPATGDLNNYQEAELWMGNVDGSEARRVIAKGQYGWTAQGVADWSPDGSQLVMAAIDESGFWHIYITKNNGQDPTRVSSRNSLFADPSWSPDGNQIVYSAYPANYDGNPLNLFALEIHTMNRDGTEERRLTFDELRDHDPYWSPDAREIVFESQHDLLHCLIGSWAVRKVDLQTGDTTNLVFDENANGVSRWSHDSQYIYFPRTTCGNFSRLMRIDRDGGNMLVAVEIPETNVLDGDIVD